MWSNILFNSVDLTTLPGVQINKVQFHNRPKRSVNRRKKARQHGSKVLNAEYLEKQIMMEGVLTGSTKAVFEQNRDNFFYYLEPIEGTLRVPQAGSNRNYVGTFDEPSWDEDPQGGLGVFSLMFVCSYPFGEDTSSTTAVNYTLTGSSSTHNLDSVIGGKYTVEPVITVTVNAVTDGTGKYIKITNPATGKYIQITRTWVATDVLVIDVDNKTVKVNGVAVDYTGSLRLTFEPGNSQIQYEDNLTTRSVAINMVYNKRYL